MVYGTWGKRHVIEKFKYNVQYRWAQKVCLQRLGSVCPHLSRSSTGKMGEDELVGTAELEKIWVSGDNGSCHCEGLNRLKE